MRMPVNATLVNISLSGCRVRSWIMLQRGAGVQFDWSSDSFKQHLSGTIVSRSPSASGAAFEYGISFTKLTASEADALAKEITKAQRREAMARADQPAQIAINADRVNRRHAFRANTQFPVTLRFEEQNMSIDAQATDLSAGGLRIICDQPFLRSGDEFIVRFRLPDEVLRVFPKVEKDKVRETPFGPRRDTVDNRRGFEEMSIRSRVQRRLEDRHARPTYGITFVEVDAYSREEIARFIHASQLTKLSSSRLH